MKRALLILSLLCASAIAVFAQSTSVNQTVTLSSTATGLSGTTGLSFCRLYVSGGAVRFSLNGTAPTASTGEALAAGDRVILMNAPDVRNFSAIATSTTTTTINAACGSGNTPDVSSIQPSTAISVTAAALPVSLLPKCNPVTKPNGLCQ